MIIIVDITDKAVADVWKEDDILSELPNGYIWIKTPNIAYPNDLYVAYSEVTEVPEDAISKYCYDTFNGFYLNPNYVQANPYGIADDLLERIKNDTIAEVQEVTNGKM